MTRHAAKAITLAHLGGAEITLIDCGPEGHGPIVQVGILKDYIPEGERGCGRVYVVDGKSWEVYGFGPTNSHRQRALVKLVVTA